MGSVAVATVWTGNSKYQAHHVERIRNMVLRHCGDWEVEFLCYTDQPQVPDGWRKMNLMIYPWEMREGWWGKMQLFDSLLRGPLDVVYFDLDTVIVGDITPLFKLADSHFFGICKNFTRMVSPDYPCLFGSCTMTINKRFGDAEFHVWSSLFASMKKRAGQYGDQYVIQEMIPDAMILQDNVPKGFFVGRRDFKKTLDPSNAVMVFAGRNKPENTHLPWVKEHWK